MLFFFSSSEVATVFEIAQHGICCSCITAFDTQMTSLPLAKTIFFMLLVRTCVRAQTSFQICSVQRWQKYSCSSRGSIALHKNYCNYVGVFWGRGGCIFAFCVKPNATMEPARQARRRVYLIDFLEGKGWRVCNMSFPRLSPHVLNNNQFVYPYGSRPRHHAEQQGVIQAGEQISGQVDVDSAVDSAVVDGHVRVGLQQRPQNRKRK